MTNLVPRSIVDALSKARIQNGGNSWRRELFPWQPGGAGITVNRGAATRRLVPWCRLWWWPVVPNPSPLSLDLTCLRNCLGALVFLAPASSAPWWRPSYQAITSPLLLIWLASRTSRPHSPLVAIILAMAEQLLRRPSSTLSWSWPKERYKGKFSSRNVLGVICKYVWVCLGLRNRCGNGQSAM
jgi:hypothetical protein